MSPGRWDGFTATAPAVERGPPQAGGQDGTTALLTLLAGMLLLGVALALVTVAVDVGVAAARARTAADAAALAGAGAAPLAGGDGDARGAAARLAAANGAELRRCCDASHPRPALPGLVEVEVTVVPRGPLVRALLPGVPARAAAALRPPPPPGGRGRDSSTPTVSGGRLVVGEAAHEDTPGG